LAAARPAGSNPETTQVTAGNAKRKPKRQVNRHEVAGRQAGVTACGRQVQADAERRQNKAGRQAAEKETWQVEEVQAAWVRKGGGILVCGAEAARVTQVWQAG